jgi:hypothetical protein
MPNRLYMLNELADTAKTLFTAALSKPTRGAVRYVHAIAPIKGER